MDPETLADALAGDEDGRKLLALDALRDDPSAALAPELVGPLLASLGSARKAIQRTAADAVARFARSTPELRDRLVEMLGSADFRRRWGAAFALAKLGPSAEMLPVLLEAFGEADGDLRWAAATIVVALARERDEVRAALVTAVRSGSPNQRKMAIYALRDGGRTERDLAEALADALASDDSGVRLAALSALGMLYADQSDAARRAIAVAREDADPGVRRAATSVLGRFSSPDVANDIERILAEAERSDDLPLRKAAAAARRLREALPSEAAGGS